MFSNPEARAAGNPSAPRPDARESEEEYEDFYIELFQELAKYGEVEDLVVCDNLGDHLVGNVYAKFYDEEDVASAIQGLFGRFYNKHKLQVEYSPVTDFRESRCRQYDEGRCARGGFCNFMHIKKVPREIKRELMKTQPQHGVRSGGGGGGGRGDEQGGNDYHRRGASSGRGSGRRRSPSPYGGGRPSSSSGGSRRDRDRGSSSRRDRDDRGDRGREGGSGGLAPEAAANGDSSGAPPSRRRGGRSSDRERRRQRRRERDSVGESGGGDGVSAGAAYAKEDEKMVGQAQPVGMEGQALPAVAPPTADGAVPVPPPTSAY